ncbi:MAG: 50S ribosomal protein L23 [Candidatus Gracilibacteria bacterium]|jgi:large subunit ribosomal protein L23
MDSSHIIKKPLVTEKSMKGEVNRKFTFLINSNATKIDIKRAFKEIYGVDVVKVNIVPVFRKARLIKNNNEFEKRASGQKAVITIKKGQKFDFNKIKEVK